MARLGSRGAAASRPLPGATPAPAAGADRIPDSPPARRVRAPSWLDLRLVIGVLLVLVSVVVGARVLGEADESTTVWGVSKDLAAGTVLEASDLVKVRVRLFDNASRYMSTDSSPAGKVLGRPMLSGELIPRAALVQPESVVQLPLSVPAERVPRDLAHGQLVDIYASVEQQGQPPQTTLVLAGVTILKVDGRGEGALSVGSQRLQVLISVPSCRVAAIIDATEGKTVSLAVLEGVTSDEQATPDDCRGSNTGSGSGNGGTAEGSGVPSSSAPPTGGGG